MPSFLYLGLIAPFLWTSLLLTNLVNAQNQMIKHPIKYRTNAGFLKYTANARSSCITLNGQNPLVTLDYGTEAMDIPLFYVEFVSDPVQVEAKYSEPYSGLDEPYRDGPFDFANGFSNTFRVETFNVTTTGRVESFFIQGGLRWQNLKPLTEGSIRVCGLGLRSANDRTPIDQLPGFFESSNSLYNEIWALGVRALQQVCIAAGTAPYTWEVTADGPYLRGQQTAQSVKGASFANYTLEFDAKIIRADTGWKVAAGVAGYGAYFVLTSNYPSQSSFVNINRTVVPPNTLASQLTTGKVNYYPLPFDVQEDQCLSGGTWGFGPYQDQTALVKDVQVYSQNVTLLYQNPMTSDEILEYGIMGNTHNLCLDGAKRDRLVWSGDFIHTSRIIQASTSRSDFISGTLDYLIDRQAGNSSVYEGFFRMEPGMGQSAKYADIYNSFSLLDYQSLILEAVAQYYKNSGDRAFLLKHWFKIEKGVETVLQLVDKQSGLAGMFFLGSSNGTAALALLAHTLTELAELAATMNATDAASLWAQHANSIKTTINQELWGSELRTLSIAGSAWEILCGIANTTQTKSIIAALSSLRLGLGYNSSTSVANSSSTNLSPFLSGFLLEAILQESRKSSSASVARTTAISVLLDQLWVAMVNQDEYYTGASWEYLSPDGRPGLDLITSHSHPWGGAPTYVFSEYVLGVQPTAAGFATWIFQPAILDINPSWARGRVSTPQGTIQASWRLSGAHKKHLQLQVCGPKHTKALVSLPFTVKSYTVNGKSKVVSKTQVNIAVTDSSCADIHVTLL
ncbi:glycoside hydrolase family 78 protein [Aspergillus pseudoustus]|uniref:Glycoside hydrolase family 78 protein n=1 Tax=Aspergillus pseudoustus TaxID=1810923 RepID=A0ABR4IQN1_9EURO